MIYIVYIALLPFSNWLFLNVFFLDFPNTFRLICARFVFLGYISSSPFRFFIFIYNIIFINFHVGTSNGFSRTSQIFPISISIFVSFVFLLFSCVFLLACFTLSSKFCCWFSVLVYLVYGLAMPPPVDDDPVGFLETFRAQQDQKTRADSAEILRHRSRPCSSSSVCLIDGETRLNRRWRAAARSRRAIHLNRLKRSALLPPLLLPLLR